MNVLDPGAAGKPAPSPADAEANPLQAQPAAQPQPNPRPAAMNQFDAAEAAAAAKFGKLKELDGQMRVIQAEMNGLMALADTVTMDDVVKASASIVAAGIPAVTVASTLAEVPQNSEAIAVWVASKAAEAAEQNKMLQASLASASYELGLASFQSILADSAEGFHAGKARRLKGLN